MKKMMICKACGYIAAEGKLGAVCPACGVPRSAFLPFQDRVAPKRRRVLNLHLHSVMVHFPQAFALFMLFALVMAILFRRHWLGADFLISARVLSLFLPISVLVSLVSGILDGKTRFKRANTIILKRKIALAAGFLLFSIGTALILNLSLLQTGWLFSALALTALCVLVSLILGYNGGRLVGLVIPG